MNSELFFAVVLSLFIALSNSQLDVNNANVDDLTKQYGGLLSQGMNVLQNTNMGALDQAIGQPADCMKKLMPCQPYIQSTMVPPATCCDPLMDLVANESNCICGLVGNDPIFKTLNLTMDGAIDIAKNCGATVDPALCQNATSATSSIAPIATPLLQVLAPALAPANNSAADEKSGGLRLSHEEKFTFIAFFLSFIFSLLSV